MAEVLSSFFRAKRLERDRSSRMTVSPLFYLFFFIIAAVSFVRNSYSDTEWHFLIAVRSDIFFLFKGSICTPLRWRLVLCNLTSFLHVCSAFVIDELFLLQYYILKNMQKYYVLKEMRPRYLSTVAAC